MILLLMPWVILLAYFGGLLFVLGMPARLVASYPAEEVGGHGYTALHVTFVGNLVLALFCIIAAIIVVVLAFTWLRSALFYNRGESSWIIGYIAASTVIMIVASCVTSYSVVVNNNLYDHITDAHTDLYIATEEYSGVAYIRGTAALEGDATEYFIGQDDWYYDLRILENGTSWVTVYLPLEMAVEQGIDNISKNEPYDQVILEYLPHTYVVSEIWREGEKPVPVEEEDEAA